MRVSATWQSSCSLFDQGASLKLHLSEGLLRQVLELPGTTYTNMQNRATVLSGWKEKLRKGALPRATEESWPVPVLQKQLLQTLSKLEMPRFCRKYPQLLDSLLKQLVQVVHDYEAEMAAEEEKQSSSPPPQNMQGTGANPQPNNTDSQQQQQQQSQGGDGDQQPSAEDLKNANGSGGEGDGQQIEVQLDDAEATGQQRDSEQEKELQAKAEELAEEIVEKFEKEWAPIMDGVKEAAETFDNLDGLMDGPHGFDSSRSVWKNAGWREVKELRRILEDLKELTALVRSLGRSSGKGELRRAPQEVYASRGKSGVHRSPLQPEETHSLSRSGDITRMLPFELHLLAADSHQTEQKEPTEEGAAEEWGPLRRLHMARRAERALLSYERSGWLENEPTRTTAHNEIRPSTEMGPIICCLDTSGSMHGARETVAKAVTLECMRGAYRQKRQCYLYAFGGPGEVQELALDLRPGTMQQLLSFLQFSFGGGTDVDRPLEMSLERLQHNEWKQADILMVTDGEIPMPKDQLLDQLGDAKEDLGLELHGLLVGRHESKALQQLTTHLHVFKSWSTVKASKYDYA